MLFAKFEKWNEEGTVIVSLFPIKFQSVRKGGESGGGRELPGSLRGTFFFFSLACAKGARVSLLLLGLCSFPGTLGTLSAKDGKGVGGLHRRLHKQGF